MKVYLATGRDYDDIIIVGIFSSLEKAHQANKEKRKEKSAYGMQWYKTWDFDVEEYEVE